MRRGAAPLFLALALTACGEDGPAPKRDAGHAAGGCAPGEIELPGGVCTSPGVAPDGCGTGFETDGDHGCTAVLPDPCALGTFAVPGEDACHEVAPCAAGAWGDIPVEAGTQHVDASLGGPSADGSALAPWKTIQEAVDAAEPGGMVAVAAGTYDEDLEISGHPVRIWGVCPSKVIVRGSGKNQITFVLRKNVGGSEVHGISITGPSGGFVVSGSEDVLLDRIWIHDAAGPGVALEDDSGATSVTLRASLIEAAREYAIYVRGAAMTIEDSTIRDTASTTQSLSGAGVYATSSMTTGNRAVVTLRRSVLERSSAAGAVFAAADGIVEDTLVRDTAPVTPGDGWGLGAVEDAQGAPANLTVRRSVIERSVKAGVAVIASDATLEASVVRDTAPLPDKDNSYGWGIALIARSARRPSLTLRGSLVDRSTEGGVVAFGADVLFDSARVRDTFHGPDLRRGTGVNLQRDLPTAERSIAVLSASAIERSEYTGLLVVDSDATVDASLVGAVTAQASDGLYGDGVAVVAIDDVASGAFTGCRIEHGARAGVSSFSAHVAIAQTVLDCNLIDLDGEATPGPYDFEDAGGNVCGCDGETHPCQVKTSNLAAPAPLAPE